MGSIVSPETSVENYHHTLRNIPEERRSHLVRGGSLKSSNSHLFEVSNDGKKFSVTIKKKTNPCSELNQIISPNEITGF